MKYKERRYIRVARTRLSFSQSGKPIAYSVGVRNRSRINSRSDWVNQLASDVFPEVSNYWHNLRTETILDVR